MNVFLLLKQPPMERGPDRSTEANTCHYIFAMNALPHVSILF